MTISPEPKKKANDEVDQGSPSKDGLLDGPISPRAELERELERCKSLISCQDRVLKFNVTVAAPAPPVRLSALVHPSVFIAPRSPDPETIEEPAKDTTRLSPEPPSPPTARTITGSRSLDSPNTKRRVAEDYERLLSVTTGVKKVGLGYQSDIRGATANVLTSTPSKRTALFHSTRKAIPPSVSSKDWRRTVSVDELARPVPSTPEPISKEERVVGTASAMKRAFMAITGKTGAKRPSRRPP